MRRIGMLLLGVCVLTFAGCGTDERAPVVDEVINQLSVASTKVSIVRKKVAEAVALAEKNAAKEDRPVKASDLTAKEMQPAMDAVKGLKEASKTFLNAARNAQAEAERTTTQQQNENTKQLGAKLQTALVSMDNEQTKLREEIAKAHKINPTLTKELTKNLSEAQAEFEAVIKRS